MQFARDISLLRTTTFPPKALFIHGKTMSLLPKIRLKKSFPFVESLKTNTTTQSSSTKTHFPKNLDAPLVSRKYVVEFDNDTSDNPLEILISDMREIFQNSKPFPISQPKIDNMTQEPAEDNFIGGTFEGVGLTDLLHQVTNTMTNYGQTVPSRAGETKELLSVTLMASDPRDRIIRCPERGANVIAQIAETLWVLGGSNELKYLTPFLKRAPQFSDDHGNTWRSAYGVRLRAFPSPITGTFDQLQHCIELLRNDKTTRRAFITISYPPIDHQPGIDVACNVFMSFLVRDNKLNMSVFNRSNDLIWGFSGINFFEFSAIQEFVAGCVNLEVGTYTHHTQSLHVYDKYYNVLDKIYAVKEEQVTENSKFNPKNHMPFSGCTLGEYDQLFTQYKHRLDTYFNAKSVREAHDTLAIAAGEFLSLLKTRSNCPIAIYFSIPFLELIFKDKTFDLNTKNSLYSQFNTYCSSAVSNSYLQQAVDARFLKNIKEHTELNNQPII